MAKNCLDMYSWADRSTHNIEINRIKGIIKLDLTPGCGGVRRRTKQFEEKGFIEFFINAILLRKREHLKESTWVVGGDGRYYCMEGFRRAVGVMAGLKVKNIITAKDAIFTSPCMSLIVRKYNATGGIYFSANHLAGGPAGYFGIKYLVEDGTTVSDSVLDQIYQLTEQLEYYRFAPISFPLDKIGTHIFGIEDVFVYVTVMDAVRFYAERVKTYFDFDMIRNLLFGDDIVGLPYKILIDCMNGSSGPFVHEIFVNDLNVPSGTVINEVPVEVFASGYPSPRNSKGLVQGLRYGTQEAGFALGTVGERVMVMGKDAFQVYSSDSVAVIGDHLHCIPYFQANGIKGYARSFVTSLALNKVAESKKRPSFELPTYWEYFTDMIKNKKVSFCGDYNYGMGFADSWEKDGIMGILAWLSVLYHLRMSVIDVMQYHWSLYGRYFTARIVYEKVDAKTLYAIIDYIDHIASHEDIKGSIQGKDPFEYIVLNAEKFKHKDIVGKTMRVYGVVLTLHPESRITYRIGIGKTNRLRIYLESHSCDSSFFNCKPVAMLCPLAKFAMQMINIRHFLTDVTPKYML